MSKIDIIDKINLDDHGVDLVGPVLPGHPAHDHGEPVVPRDAVAALVAGRLVASCQCSLRSQK